MIKKKKKKKIQFGASHRDIRMSLRVLRMLPLSFSLYFIS